ncbi:MAG: flippase [Ktedonobacteraceae bacterium]
MSVSLAKEYLADADTTPSIASWTPLSEQDGRTVRSRNEQHNFFSSLTEEQIALLDTAMMASVRPRESGPGYTGILVDTLIEDITKQATLGLPRITQATEKADQLEQRKDITTTAGGAVIAGMSDLSSGILRFVTNVAMTHMVSPAVFGIFGEIYTIILILGWIAKLGLEGVLICLLPVYRVKGERNLAGGLARFTTWIILLSGSLIGALFFAFAAVIARLAYHDLSYRLPLQEASLLIPLLALQLSFASGLQAFKEIKWKVLTDRLSQPVITLMMLVVFYLLGWRMEALIFSAIGGFFCSVLIGQITFSKVVKRFTTDAVPKYTPRVWTSFAVPMFFNGLIYGISNSTDILFLSIFASPIQAGVYIVADRVSNFVVMPLFALNMIFSPLIAEYHIQGKREQLASMLKLVTKWSLLLSLPIFLCCLVFHDAILEVFGPQYTADWLVLIILCFGNLVNTGTGSVLQLLVMTRRLRIVSINSITTLVLNIGLSFLLVPHFNSMGAALAATLAVIVNNVLCLIEVYWLMKIHPYRWDVCKPFIAGGAASLVGVLLLHFIQPGSGRLAIVEKLGLIMPFVLVYALVMVVLRFSVEDKMVFDAVRAKFGKQRSSNQLRVLS